MLTYAQYSWTLDIKLRVINVPRNRIVIVVPRCAPGMLTCLHTARPLNFGHAPKPCTLSVVIDCRIFVPKCISARSSVCLVDTIMENRAVDPLAYAADADPATLEEIARLDGLRVR